MHLLVDKPSRSETCGMKFIEKINNIQKTKI